MQLEFTTSSRSYWLKGLADGQPCELNHLSEAKAYSVVAKVPYARKIERGESKKAPSGVYEVVAVLASQRFDSIGHVGFGYRSPLVAYGAGSKNSVERAALCNQPERLSAMQIGWRPQVRATTVTVG